MSIYHASESYGPGSPSACISATGTRRPRRQMTREAGQAIERLAHAVEYLCDEVVQERGTMFVGDPRLEAVQILTSLQRSVYCECPPYVSRRTRIRMFFANILAAKPGPEMTSTALK